MAQSVIIPKVMWVFNPTYIRVEGVEERSVVTLTIGERSILMPLYKGNNDIQMNSLVQLLFTNPNETRSLKFKVTLSGSIEEEEEVLAIWGCLDFEDKCLQYGRFVGDTILRKVRYYSNFPFSIDELTMDGFRNRAITNEGEYESTFVKGKVITKVIKYNDKEGVYLRWIDRFGFIQYFLFKKGDKEIRTAADDNDVEEMKNVYGMGYTRHFRPLNVASEDTIKVCADNLDNDEIQYVTSILGSPIVDMYVNGEWKPIRVSDGSYVYSVHHLTQKQDFEITIITNERESQSL